MKPLTYYVQHSAITRLVEFYGPFLERMSREDKLTLMAVLISQLANNNHIKIELNPNINDDLAIHVNQLAESADNQKLALIVSIASELSEIQQ